MQIGKFDVLFHIGRALLDGPFELLLRAEPFIISVVLRDLGDADLLGAFGPFVAAL
jgi:hypothetical protein